MPSPFLSMLSLMSSQLNVIDFVSDFLRYSGGARATGLFQFGYSVTALVADPEQHSAAPHHRAMQLHIASSSRINPQLRLMPRIDTVRTPLTAVSSVPIPD